MTDPIKAIQKAEETLSNLNTAIRDAQVDCTMAHAGTLPTDISGLTMWLDAGSLSLADGASVSDWQSSGGTADTDAANSVST